MEENWSSVSLFIIQQTDNGETIEEERKEWQGSWGKKEANTEESDWSLQVAQVKN